MRSMIMAAGLGTRLRPLTGPIPKPMVPIANRPALEHILLLLGRHGMTEVVVNLHHSPESVTDYFGDGGPWGVDLTYSFEPQLLGTAGGVKNNEAFLGGGAFLVMSGDSLTDVDLGSVVAAHRVHGGVATLVVSEVDDPSEYGVVVLGDQGRVVGFQEKPPVEEARSNLCNCGIYVFEPAIFERIPAAAFYDFGRMVFPELLRDGIPMFAHVTREYWNDVGSLPAYRQGCADALLGAVAVDVPGDEVERGVWRGAESDVGQVHTRPPVAIGRACRVEEGADLTGPLSLGDGCFVGRDTRLAGSVVWDEVSVGRGAVVVGSVIASGVLVGDGVRMDGAVIGERCVVGDGVDLGAAVLEPGTVIGEVR